MIRGPCSVCHQTVEVITHYFYESHDPECWKKYDAPRKLLARLKAGERVQVQDAELDAVQALDDPAVPRIASLPNPEHYGTKSPPWVAFLTPKGKK